jgi:carboxylate-amine ligase
VGIEEEYLVVDRETRDLVAEPPPELLQRGLAETGGLVTPEFLQSQLEVGTSKCDSVPEAAAEIRELRTVLSRVAAEFGYAIIAASTHPFGDWTTQRFTPKERYDQLAQDHGVVAQRMLICGMHVHVGIDDDELRIDLMEQATYFLPHMLAMSTSSPFWHGYPTGLRSYRLSIFDGMPRTGLPGTFDSWAEYERHLGVLIHAGQIEDASKIWWDLRPSGRFPTLEMRIADVCTTAAHGASVAAVFQSVLAMLWQLKRDNQRWRTYSTMLVQENRWRAQRYGIDEGLIDFGLGEVVPCADLIEELIEMLTPSGQRLGCHAELQGVRSIMAEGTSAHRQMAIYEEALATGAEQQEAVRNVVDFLIDETLNF